MNDLQKQILEICWKDGGYAFGGTARDLIRGAEPNDLDLRFETIDAVKQIAALVEGAKIQERLADRGEEYYDSRVTFPDGTPIDVKFGRVSVTDMDVNLVTLYRDRASLLYVPGYLKGSLCPLSTVLSHIAKMEFMPLWECEAHRQYRWDEFVKRGWKRLEMPVRPKPVLAPATEHKRNILKNEECEIEIERNPWGEPERANHYFRVTLLNGAWPKESLIPICDNNAFGQPNRTFGGAVESCAPNKVKVTVYVD